MSESFYQKKPLVIEAFRFGFDDQPEWCLHSEQVKHCSNTDCDWLEIDTLEGTMIANDGDYVIKGIKGEIYPCRDDIFESSYDLVASQMREPEVEIVEPDWDSQRGWKAPVDTNPSRE